MQKKFLGLLLFAVGNSFVLLVFDSLFKQAVVLGNRGIPAPTAAVLGGLIIGAFSFGTSVMMLKNEFKLKEEYFSFGKLFVGAIVGLWLIKRLADFTGVGIANNFYVILIAFSCAILATLILRLTQKVKKS